MIVNIEKLIREFPSFKPPYELASIFGLAYIKPTSDINVDEVWTIQLVKSCGGIAAMSIKDIVAKSRVKASDALNSYVSCPAFKGSTSYGTKILDTYKKLVEERKSQKIDYHLWRTLVKFFNNYEKYAVDLCAPYDDHFSIMFYNDGTIGQDKALVPKSFLVAIAIATGLVSEEKSTNINEAKDIYTDTCTSASTIALQEDNKMTVMNNFKFGPTNNVRMSPLGIAVPNQKGQWFTYDRKSKKTMDVTDFCFALNDLIYMVPQAPHTIDPGDVVLHNNIPVFVTERDNGKIIAVDVLCSEEKTIVPTSNIFGFDFVTKIMPIVSLPQKSVDKDNPFGSIMPMMMMSKMLGNKSNDEGGLFSGDLGKMMMISLFTGNTDNPFHAIFGNMFAGSPSKEPATAD